MNPERYVTAEILQLVLEISRASSYRLAHELGRVKIGRLNSVRVRVSAVREKLGSEIADAVEYESQRALIKQAKLGLVDVEPLSEERWAAVEERVAAWKVEREARGRRNLAETAETSAAWSQGAEDAKP